jgi:hypothetical protein
MWEALDESGRRAILLAQEECRRRRHQRITVPDLALGALSAGAPTSRDTADRLRARLEAAAGRRRFGRRGSQLPLAAEASAVLDEAREGRASSGALDILRAALIRLSMTDLVDELRADVPEGHELPAPASASWSPRRR